MSDRTTITDTFGDGVHSFKLPFLQLVELEEKTGAGPAALLSRMLDGTWRMLDVRETLRLSLIGGGMKPSDALNFMSRYVDPMTLNEVLAAATAIMLVTINGNGPPTETPRPDGAAGAEGGTSDGD